MKELGMMESIELEHDAYRYWLGLMLVHAGSGLKVARNQIEAHLQSLRNGDPIERLDGEIAADEWDSENFRRYPIYEAVALEIIERLAVYEQSGKISDLAFNV